MKKKLYTLLLLFSAVAGLGGLFLSCSNDDDNSQNPIDQLPPETQTGANTFGFLVNGEVVNITNTSNQFAIYQGGFIQLGGGGVRIEALDPFSINTTYQFMNVGEGTSRARFTAQITENTFCLYEYGDTYEGSVTFTKIDTENFVISGVFEYSTITDDCENIDITNGRFDLQYIP